VQRVSATPAVPPFQPAPLLPERTVSRLNSTHRGANDVAQAEQHGLLARERLQRLGPRRGCCQPPEHSAVHLKEDELEGPAAGAAGAKTAFVEPFYTENDHFTKTGSGQRSEKSGESGIFRRW
jgi:hypothetical protein